LDYFSVISVIIPTRNRARFLEKAVQSVFRQRLACGELIIVDDGSTDDTARLVERLAATAPVRVRYLFQERAGAAAARNLGIRKAGGEMLCFLDSDDWWLPEKLEIQWASMQEQPGYPVSHTREIWYRRGVRVNQKKIHAPPHGDIFARALAMCVVGMSTVMIRRELFDRYGLFDPSFPCCEDYEFWLRIGCREPFLLVDRPLTCKDGGRPDQLSSRYRVGMDRFRIRAICKLLDSGVLTAQQSRLAREELVRKCRIYGQGCIKHGRLEEGAWYARLPEKYQARTIAKA